MRILFFWIGVISIFCTLGCDRESTDKIPHITVSLDTILIDNMLQDWSTQLPGGAVAIIQGGKVIYEKYIGVANLETQAPFSPETRTDIGSISKQFTACLIALLEESEKLSIEDNIRSYIPELPAYADSIKIKHLLFHVSGIKDYEALILVQDKYYFEDFMTNAYVIDLLSRQQSLNFPPGRQYEYSNSNYILLAEIVERITGKPLNTFAKEQIFEPLGMKDTFFHLNQGEDFPHRAIGYAYQDSVYKRPVYHSHLVGDGGVFTTLRDMVKWDQNFFDNQLGKKSASFIQRMTYREPLTNGPLNSMAFAQIFTPHPFGKESWSHGGSGGGYLSFYIRFEKPQFSVVVLSNSDVGNAFGKANAIVNSFFDYDPTNMPMKEEALPTPSSPDYLPIQQDLIDRFTGVYFDESYLSVVRIQLAEAGQHVVVTWLENNDQGYLTSPIDPLKLAEIEDPLYTYEIDTLERKLIHKVGANIERVWKKLESPLIATALFAGQYYSKEVEHQVELHISMGQLQAENYGMKQLIRIGNRRFWDAETKAVITFDIASPNQPIGLRIDIPGGDRNLRNLRFEKIP